MGNPLWEKMKRELGEAKKVVKLYASLDSDGEKEGWVLGEQS